MAGLFGWFNGNKSQDASAQANGSKPAAYFLDADDAKTFGDIEYMRTAKVVKRTFPKTLSSPEEFEKVESVSAMGKMVVNGKVVDVNPAMMNGASSNGASSNGAASNGAATNGASDPAITERRRSDTSMDMFRSMARDMRKR